MSGVEILAAHEVMATTFNWYVFILGIIIVSVIMIIILWKFPPSSDTGTNIFIMIFSIIMFAFPIGITASCTGEKIPCYTEYKVQLSDEVPIAEFLATYEIIDQEGQILTIKEKEIDK